MSSSFLKIDLSKPFDPEKFIAEGWGIFKREEDKRSLALARVDISKIFLVSTLERNETLNLGGESEQFISGMENLNRLKKAGYIRLDAKIFQTLWENQHLIPKSWKEKTKGNTTCIFFDGTPLRDPLGLRCFLCLYWRGGKWGYSYWLDFNRSVECRSAVLNLS